MAQLGKINVLNGVLSGFVLVSGIVVCVLTDLLFQLPESIVFLRSAYPESGTEHLWIFGIAYIVPGTVGVVTSFLRQTEMYGIQLFLMLISFLSMGIYFLARILPKITTPKCSFSTFIVDKCAILEVLLVFFCFAWIAVLAASFTAYICRRQATIITRTSWIQMGPPTSGHVYSTGHGFITSQPRPNVEDVTPSHTSTGIPYQDCSRNVHTHHITATSRF